MWYLWVCAVLMFLWIKSEKWKNRFLRKYWQKQPVHSALQMAFFSLLYGRVYIKQLTLRESQQNLILVIILAVIIRYILAIVFFPFGVVVYAFYVQQRNTIAKCFNYHNLGRGQTYDELDSSQRHVANHAKIKRIRMYCPTLDACRGGELPKDAHHCIELCPVFNENLPQLILLDEDEQEYNDSADNGDCYMDLNDYKL